jgi:hypothetical protein
LIYDFGLGINELRIADFGLRIGEGVKFQIPNPQAPGKHQQASSKPEAAAGSVR